jgi:hypothetical protein
VREKRERECFTAVVADMNGMRPNPQGPSFLGREGGIRQYGALPTMGRLRRPIKVGGQREEAYIYIRNVMSTDVEYFGLDQDVADEIINLATTLGMQ